MSSKMIPGKIKPYLLIAAISIISAISKAQTDTQLTLTQADSIYFISDSQTVFLKKDSFSFIFYLYDYNDQKNHPNTLSIHCSLDKNIFNIYEGQSADSITFFSIGSGMATAHSKPYRGIIINEYGQHYIMYSKLNTVARRAILLKEFENKLYKLQWNIPIIIHDKQDIPLKQIKFKDLYLIAFIDANKNRTLDKGEFLRFTLNFEI